MCKISGCSSARLEYTSGGRVVARSNRVIPTDKKGFKINFLVVLKPFFALNIIKNELII